MNPRTLTIRQFLGGDEAAFESIYRDESKRLARFIRRYVRSADQAEDLFQEIWIRVWTKRDQLRDPDRFTSWLYRIARNGIMEAMRKKGQGIQIQVMDNPPGDELSEDRIALVPDPGPGPLQRAVASEWIGAIDRELDKLDPQAKEIMALRFGAGMSLREISEILEAPLGTVCTKVSRSLKALKASLERKGMTRDSGAA